MGNSTIIEVNHDMYGELTSEEFSEWLGGILRAGGKLHDEFRGGAARVLGPTESRYAGTYEVKFRRANSPKYTPLTPSGEEVLSRKDVRGEIPGDFERKEKLND